MDWNFELVSGPYGGTTEGPVWDGQNILFSYIPGSVIFKYDPKTGETTNFFTGTLHTNGLCFDAVGNLYGCLQGGRGIGRFEKNGSTLTTLPRLLDGKQLGNPNDLAIDKQGRIWFTDPYSGSWDIGAIELDHQSVLRLDPQNSGGWNLSRATYDISRPNGVLISRDQQTLYVAQSDYSTDQPRQLRAYSIGADGSLGSYTTLHTFAADHRGAQRGVDGMTLDADGNIVVCAGWEEAGPGPMIYVFAPSGRILSTHPFRVDRPTNCCFGDPDMKTLYVTTGGGHLFKARTEHTGWVMWP